MAILLKHTIPFIVGPAQLDITQQCVH